MRQVPYLRSIWEASPAKSRQLESRCMKFWWTSADVSQRWGACARAGLLCGGKKVGRGQEQGRRRQAAAN